MTRDQMAYSHIVFEPGSTLSNWSTGWKERRRERKGQGEREGEGERGRELETSPEMLTFPLTFITPTPHTLFLPNNVFTMMHGLR